MTRSLIAALALICLAASPLCAQRPRPDVTLSAGAMELYRQTGLLFHGTALWPLRTAGRVRLGLDAALGTAAIREGSSLDRRYVHLGARFEYPLGAPRGVAPFLGARVALAHSSNDSWATLPDGSIRVAPAESKSGGAATGPSVGALAGLRIRLSPLFGIVSTASLDYLRLYSGQSTSRSWSWTAGFSIAQ